MLRIDSLSVGMRPGAPGRGLPPRLRALRPAARETPTAPVFTMPIRAFTIPIRVFTMPIRVITMRDLGVHDGRSARSRCPDPGDHDAPIPAITIARDPHRAGRASSPRSPARRSPTRHGRVIRRRRSLAGGANRLPSRAVVGARRAPARVRACGHGARVCSRREGAIQQRAPLAPGLEFPLGAARTARSIAARGTGRTRCECRRRKTDDDEARAYGGRDPTENGKRHI